PHRPPRSRGRARPGAARPARSRHPRPRLPRRAGPARPRRRARHRPPRPHPRPARRGAQGEAGAESRGHTMNRVYIANMGEANALWPRAHANSTILTYDNVNLHPYWQAGDRDGYIAKAVGEATTARGDRPTKQTAGRWYNLIEELRATEGDLWITRQGAALWWAISDPGALRETLIGSTNPARDGPEVWVLEKPCQPWSDRDREGRALLWDALHPKSRDFLVTEATFQSVQNDRAYADYARALVSGQPLDRWHQTTLFKNKAAEARKPGARLFSPKEKSAAEMTRNLLGTVAQANGQIVE